MADVKRRSGQRLQRGSILLAYESKMAHQEWQCPFCQNTSTRPQGLAAHIRSGHPKQYPKWLKNPQRLQDALKAAAQQAPKSLVVPQPADEAPRRVPQSMNGNPTMDLLNQAHSQLRTRKQSIEAELARLDDLNQELQIINAQIESLDKTLVVFQKQTTPDS